MTTADETRKTLQEFQAQLRLAADKLQPLIDLADSPLFSLLSSSGGLEGLAKVLPMKTNRLSENARKSISEANKNFWVVCPRAECNGVRHRKTHPHIAGPTPKKKRA